MNTIHCSSFLLATLGVLSGAASAQPDTSKWTCSSCPYPKGTEATIEVGIGTVSDASRAFGDWRGLERKGAHLVLGGELLYRGADGYYADAVASELGLDTRSLAAASGREGLYGLNLSYTSLPRHYADGARTPFLGVGSTDLGLPAGYPAATSSTMPLATTLRDAALGLDWRRLSFGGNWIGVPNWTFSVQLRRDQRSGTRPISASFFATAAQLPAPVDEVSDQLELAASYTSGPLQGRLAYVYSQFSNDAGALRWTNPFNAVTPGATRGQMALAPDNEQHQIVGSGAYTVTSWLRASGDFSLGRLTQNAGLLPATITPSITSPALPAASLDGTVDSFHASLRLTATPTDSLRLNGVYTRDVRENRTRIKTWPQIATDLFATSGPRNNMPADVWQDRLKLSADWRGPGSVRVATGAEWDQRERSFAEAVRTRETTVWLRGGVQPVEMLTLALKFAGSDRSHSGYGVATWLTTPENPLLRKYNLAERQREAASLRADLAVGENLSIGLGAEYARDDYERSLVGLRSARSSSATVDVAYSFSEETRVYAFAQGERIRSTQAGSQLLSGPFNPDWAARNQDRFDVVGLGLKTAAIPDKLDIGADASVARSRSETLVQTIMLEPSLPTDKTSHDIFKVYASYKLSEQMTLLGSWAYERYESRDWRLDGVLPGTVPGLLAFGQESPRYKVNVIRLSLRYRY